MTVESLLVEDQIPTQLLSDTFERSAVGKAIAGLLPGRLGRLVTVNPAACAMLGYRREELTGRPVTDVRLPQDALQVTEALAAMARGELDHSEAEQQLVRKDGSLIWVTARSLVIRRHGVPAFVVTESVDSSARHAHQQALAESEARFRSMFDSSPIGMAVVGLDGAWLRANQAVARITGYAIPELSGRNFQSITHPDDLEAELALVERLLDGSIPDYRLHKRYLRRDGRPVRCLLTMTLIRDEAGRPLHFLAQIVDLDTERRGSELLDTMFASSTDLLMVTTTDGRVLRVNASWQRLLGRSEAELQGVQLGTLLEPAPQACAGGLSRCRTADGQGRWLQWTSSKLPDELLLHTARDVTEELAVSEALSQAEGQARAAFEHSPLGMEIADGHPVWVRVSGALVRDGAGRPAYLVAQVQDITDRLRFEAQLAERAQLLDLTQDAVIVRASQLAELYAGGRDSFSAETRLVRADGSMLDVHASLSVIRDRDGHPERFVGIFQDISDRLAAELARDAAIGDLADRNSQLEAANQLKLDLIGMLGHEIGNPLAVILGNTELADDPDDELDGEQLRALLRTVNRNAHRLQGIVGEVLALVTLDAGELTATPETVTLADHLHPVLAGAGVTGIAVDLPEGLAVTVQPGHLEQILTNLVSNAAKYGGGATRISAEQDGTVVRIRVEDAGPGVPEQFREHLFERFWRGGSAAGSVTGTVAGTGLGLYIVRALAHANSGEVHYEPGPHGGSVFVITLPAAA